MMLSRRALIGKAAVGAAAAVAVGAARSAIGSTRSTPTGANGHDPGDALPPPESPASTSPAPTQPETSAAPPPWELVRPLAAGAAVGHGWRLADLGPVQHGSCAVTLENARGRAHRVHLCRNDGTPQGLVYTRRLDLVVMNGGYGELPTDEGLGQAVAALAHVVAANEATVPNDVFAALLPHAERVRQFAPEDGTPATQGKLR